MSSQCKYLCIGSSVIGETKHPNIVNIVPMNAAQKKYLREGDQIPTITTTTYPKPTATPDGIKRSMVNIIQASQKAPP